MIFIQPKHCPISLNSARAVNRFSGCKKAIKRGGPIVRPFLEAPHLVEQSLGILGANPQDFEQETKEKFLHELDISKEEIERFFGRTSNGTTRKIGHVPMKFEKN